MSCDRDRKIHFGYDSYLVGRCSMMLLSRWDTDKNTFVSSADPWTGPCPT